MQKREETWTYQCEYVRCGKKSCSACPHGPYWYGYRRRDGLLRKKYFGREDPRGACKRPPEERPADWDYDDIFDANLAGWPLAFRILGVPAEATDGEVREAYRRMCLEHHPDRGGLQKRMQQVQAAYALIKRLRRGR